MLERVHRYKEKTPLFEGTGVDAEIRSTLNRRVDLPSGGYLVFDYAEAFTVIDVNTGRFVGSRSKNSTGRLEDTITKNNLEAVKEVVRQLRLRDIGGIIVIDFIDMANPKNRATVEEALRTELERDRTKTYVVEISPLGLVEMTRQNVTDGPREILTKKCPTCAGDGIVLSEASAALEVERRLRALAAGSRAQAFRVEVSPRIASLLLGPGGSRLAEIEEAAKKRFFLVPKEGVHADHAAVLAEGKLVDLQPEAPVAEGAEVELKLVELDKHDAGSAVGKLDGLDVVVGGAAKLVGKKAKVRIERVLDGVAYAALLAGAREAGGADHVRERGREADARPEPREEGRPSSRPRRPSAVDEAADEPGAGRGARAVELGSRRGRGRRRARGRAGGGDRGRGGPRGRRRACEEEDAPRLARRPQPEEEAGRRDAEARRRGRPRPRRPPTPRRPRPRLHVARGRRGSTFPTSSSADDEKPPRRRRRSKPKPEPEPTVPRTAMSRPRPSPTRSRPGAREDGDAAPVKKKTRRGSRGGRNRKKPAAAAAGAAAVASENGAEAPAEPVVTDEPEAVRQRRRAGHGRVRADVRVARRPGRVVATIPRLAGHARVSTLYRLLMSTYAIISVGGKQYRVREGEKLLVDRLAHGEGKTFSPAVLLVGGGGETHDLADGRRPSRPAWSRTSRARRSGSASTGRRTATRSTPASARACRRSRSSRSAARSAPRRSRPRAEDRDEEPRPRREDERGAAPAEDRVKGMPRRLRGADGRRDQGAVLRLEPADARGGARVRAGARQAQGRDRRDRERARREGERLMAHKKGLGSSRNGRDSNPKRLGVKIFAGQKVKAGMIIVRQRGTRFRPGPGTDIGRDDTIFAIREGTVEFRTSGEKRFISVAQRSARSRRPTKN